MAALACPSHTPDKELLSWSLCPQGGQLSGHLDAVPGSPGHSSGFLPGKWHHAREEHSFSAMKSWTEDLGPLCPGDVPWSGATQSEPISLLIKEGTSA